MPTINAIACGRLSPSLGHHPDIVENGDFDILALSESVIGDGNNEWTTWKLDFGQDPNFQSFSDKVASGWLSTHVLDRFRQSARSSRPSRRGESERTANSGRV